MLNFDYCNKREGSGNQVLNRNGFLGAPDGFVLLLVKCEQKFNNGLFVLKKVVGGPWCKISLLSRQGHNLN